MAGVDHGDPSRGFCDMRPPLRRGKDLDRIRPHPPSQNSMTFLMSYAASNACAIQSVRSTCTGIVRLTHPGWIRAIHGHRRAEYDGGLRYAPAYQTITSEVKAQG
jgi:hypothetical protein